MARIVGDIALHPSGSKQGRRNFISLATGKLIHCCIWKELPISDDVIDRVKQLVVDEGHYLVTTSFKFEWIIAGEDTRSDKYFNDDADIKDLIRINERTGPTLLEVDETEDEPEDEGIQCQEDNNQSEIDGNRDDYNRC